MSVSVMDFIPANLHAQIEDYTSTVDVSQYFQAATIAANGGVAAGRGPGGSVYVPNGLYLISRVGLRDTVIEGESREGTILRSASPGTGADFMLDAMLNRDGLTKNTQGRGWVRSLTIDSNDSGRSCLRVYGGGVDCYDLNLQNGWIGLATGLPIWSTFRNIHSLKNEVGFFTFHDVPGDIGTSATFIDCWADTCGAYGFHISQLAYSSFISCVAQDCGVNNWFIEGNLGGVPAVYSIILITCASEGSGTPFYMKKVRDLTLLNPRIIGVPITDYIVLDDAQGSIRDFSSVATPLLGKYHLKVENHTSGTGSILLDNSIVSYDPSDEIYFVISGGNANGRKGAQYYDFAVNSVTSAERMRFNSGDVDGYGGLRLFANDGKRLAAFRRIGTPIFATNGPINTPSTSLTGGDVSFHVDGTTLKFVVKGSDGIVRTGSVELT